MQDSGLQFLSYATLHETYKPQKPVYMPATLFRHYYYRASNTPSLSHSFPLLIADLKIRMFFMNSSLQDHMNFEPRTRNTIAHLRPESDGELQEHSLHEHLLKVSERAASFAVEFGNEDWAAAAGKLHDLGKYNPLWQEYLRRNNGDYSEEENGQD